MPKTCIYAGFRHLFFVMGDMENDTRTHHIHVVKRNGTEWKNYIYFRDYLNSNENVALQYQRLKEELERKYADDRIAYTSGKQEMIDNILEQCILDAKNKGKSGITVISSEKKMSFLSDPKYLHYKGFKIVDTAKPYFTLMCLAFDDNAEVPQFKDCAKVPQTDKEGFTLYYTSGCPYTAKYVPVIENYALSNGTPFRSVHLDSKEKAQKAPMAWTNYALFYNGEYVTNEILSEKKFQTICDKLMN